jgi:ATP-dependent Clp endopeptidase proteolytic subunit ClpP
MPKPVALKLIGEISDQSAALLVDQILNVAERQPIELRIASPGGSIFAGQRIITALRERGGELHTFNESLAASITSVIFALGSKRTAAQGSRAMIHKPWAGSISGESNDLRKQADLLDSLEKDIVGVYAKATGLPDDQIAQMMADETWFSADEAVAIGLATDVFGKMKGAIPVEYLNKFEHVPADLLEKEDAEPELVATTLPNTMSGLRASVRQLTGELQARTRERDDARAALARTKFLLSALERSYGLAAASAVAVVPTVEVKDALTEFESLNGEEATAFYKANTAAIIAAQNRRKYGPQ